eukprot:scaffold9074_cov141-Amphora_coffeaeformis.AAC.2
MRTILSAFEYENVGRDTMVDTGRYHTIFETGFYNSPIPALDRPRASWKHFVVGSAQTDELYQTRDVTDEQINQPCHHDHFNVI